jgi:hypothetical protein
MSEYQYYEFAAIDRPLTRAEMAKLRAISTRAEITPAGFVNHYEWGDLKADPADWMRRYFDAFVYTANWCSCRLSLRVPLATFRKGELEPFTTRYAMTIKATRTHWIVDWVLDESENNERFGMDDGSRWMRRLAPLRDELLRGDLRPLYLGWLAAAAGGEFQDAALEPEVPRGLADLSPPQRALVEFLEIDIDMLAASRAGSAKAGNTKVARSDAEQDGHLDAWLEKWSRDEMAAVLKLIARGQGQAAERQVRSRHANWLQAQHRPRSTSVRRRSVSELHELARSVPAVRPKRKGARKR